MISSPPLAFFFAISFRIFFFVTKYFITFSPQPFTHYVFDEGIIIDSSLITDISLLHLFCFKFLYDDARHFITVADAVLSRIRMILRFSADVGHFHFSSPATPLLSIATFSISFRH